MRPSFAELTGIHENHPEQTWAPAFIDLLLEMKKVKEKAIIKGKTDLSYYHLHKFDKNYDNLIELAKKRKSTSGNHGKETWPEEKGKNPCVGGTSGDIQDLSLPFYP